MRRPTVPSHWVPFISDSGWYSLSHPPTWKAERRDPWLVLHAPQEEARLSFHCVQLVREAGMSAAEVDLASLLTHRAGLARPAQLDLPYEHTGLEGPASQFAGFCGGAKEDRWRWTQVWLIRHESLLLSVLFCQAGERDPERETLGRLILASLRLAATPADPADVFTERFIAEARRQYPERRIEQTDVLSVRFGDAQLGLSNFYRQYIAAPERFADLANQVLQRAEQLQSISLQRLNPTLDAVRERIMPMLYPQAPWQGQFPQHVGEPWVGGLAILYVVDQPDTYWYIRQELLEKWKLSPEQLHELALSNLTVYWQVTPMHLHVAAGERGPSMVLPAKHDTYNAVRFLCPDFRDQLRGLFDRDFVIGLPSRDFFAATTAQSREHLQHFQQQVRSDYATSDHPLSDRLLQVTADGVSAYAR
ncbi:MAG: DUF1444 family protein [Candidatus Anammoximicrobium sp.]|nr:DUF1444 family protein [Candidatus Anammoximicrobium sp.]